MPRLLDNPRLMARVDSGDMLGAIYRFPEPLLKNTAQLATTVKPKRAKYTEIVLVGMGGSASAGDVLLDWFANKLRVPALVVREPSIPRFADSQTLVMCFSYSGDTRETLRAFEVARRRQCGLVAVGSGGILGQLCKNLTVPFFQVAAGTAPRAALTEMVVAGTVALQSLRLVGNVGGELRSTGEELAGLREEICPEVPYRKNMAKQFAYQLLRKLPVIYALQRMSSTARRFKNQLAENSKIIAKYDLFPESGHNEAESWSKLDFPCIPVLIRDWGESREEKASIQAFKSTIAAKGRLSPIDLQLKTTSSLAVVLSPILFLDYVSAYLAILRNVDPSRTPEIRKFKLKYRTMV